MTEAVPDVEDRHPADVITATVDHVLDSAASWPRWDGTPAVVPVECQTARTHTHHKAVRRVAGHLLDHLAELDVRTAGRPTEPDVWHGSMVPTPADPAPFTDHDLDGARSRLLRLGQLWDVRLRALTDQQLDSADPDVWTLRRVAFHVADPAFCAGAVGEQTAP